MSDLPAGHTSMSHHDLTDATTRVPWPERFALCCPIVYGPPSIPARVVHCLECDAPCWRSLRATDELPVVCDDCADDHLPGWREQHAPRNSEAKQ